jgi:DNA-binding transcriptional LysR family regulator
MNQAGESVYSAALKLIAGAEAFASHVNSLNHTIMTGELNIAITDGTISDRNFLLCSALAQFEKKAPKVFLNLKSLTQVEIEKELSLGLIDLGVIARHRSLPEFNYYPLHHEQNFLYCGAHHPLFKQGQINDSELQRQKFVHAAFLLNKDISQLTQQFNAAASAGHVEARAMLILSGSHIGFLPEHFAESFVQQQKLRKIQAEQQHYQTEIAAITNKGNQSNPVLSLFLATLKDQYHVNPA